MQDFSVKAYREDLKKHGVFHTDPKLAQILKKYCPNTPRSVYDPTCGVGALLSVFDDTVAKFGQELNNEYLQCAKESLKNFNGAVGDTLLNPAFLERKFDCIIANPPFSVQWEENTSDPRFKGYDAIPPRSKADYAFIMHMLYMLADDGVIVTLCFPGILYRGQREGKIRKNLVERGFVQRVVRVPGGYFEDTNISTVILVLTKKPNSTIVFENLATNKTVSKSISDIAANNYTLSPEQYLTQEVKREKINPVENLSMIQQLTVKNLDAKLSQDYTGVMLLTSLNNQSGLFENFISYCNQIISVARKYLTLCEQDRRN